MKLYLFVILGCLVCNVQCQGGEWKRRFTEQSRQFAGEVYRVIASDINGNVIFSPLSLYEAMGMVMAGASGDTHHELLRAMKLTTSDGEPFTDDRINNLMRKLYRNAVERPNGQTLRVANALYLQENYPLLGDYRDTLTEQYQAKVEIVDFSDSMTTVKTINDWVAEITENKITDLVSTDIVNSLTRLILVNAVYFKASWTTEFTSMDFPLRFTLSNGTRVDVDGIKQQGTYRSYYDSRNEMEFIAIPYNSTTPETSYFVIGLPRTYEMFRAFTTKAGSILKNLDITNWGSRRRIVQMPKFEISLDVDAKSVLMAMGVRDLFQQGASDLSGISGEDLYVSDFLHKAYIKVNKKGTEAAAASAVAAIGRAGGIQETEFLVDRPYFFGIYNDRAGAFTFVGKIEDPRV